MSKINVLLVEDEEVLALVVKETLETRGFQITIARNGVEGWTLFHNMRPDVCIIDVMMPRKDGFSLLADIRQVDEWIPVIMLTARTQTGDVLKGLETGADDYMKKPFSMEELILRLKSLLRRRTPLPAENTLPSDESTIIGAFKLNYARLELISTDKVINLSQREAELLDLLIKNKNGLLDRRTALLKLWGDDSIFNSRSMDVYISRLRKYFDNTSVEILNIRGRGYKLID